MKVEGIANALVGARMGPPHEQLLCTQGVIERQLSVFMSKVVC